MHPSHLDPATFARLATGRVGSAFRVDIDTNREKIESALRDCRVLVIGAAGSIGSAVAGRLLDFRPAELAFVDIDENGLVELTRDFRARKSGFAGTLEFLPLDAGSDEFRAWLATRPPFEYVLNFSAMKHVRSEKDLSCVERMVRTNVWNVARLMEAMPHPLKRFFSVSSDKAVNPFNLMGASKQLMEWVMDAQSTHPWASARFANVAFSKGSLLEGFLYRIAKRQPLAGPSDIRRYFISVGEAADLCLLATFSDDRNGAILVPSERLRLPALTFSDIAVAVLKELGYEPVHCGTAEEALARVDIIAKKQWPCYFAPSTTSGEKPIEEFVSAGEAVDTDRYCQIDVVRLPKDGADRRTARELAEKCVRGHYRSLAEVSDAIAEVLPTFRHNRTERSLDSGM